ncbi:Increased recombination centers protein 22 [Marasmius crinis-equi]|uniref:Increased recombination centers protein 22 n=1 Tax=Marasmius crinis-equi TaxID=585013 RepID=A0ABR3FGI2_9AGAR
MRFLKAAGALCVAYLAAAVVSAVEIVKEESAPDSDGPAAPDVKELVASAQWPDSNPFGHVVNGEKNAMTVLLENKTGKNITLLSIAGSIHNPETDKLVKNLTTLSYGIPLLPEVKLSLPYSFYSEFKPGDLRLNIWLEHLIDDVKERVPVYDSIVTIVEPEGSWFDLKLLSTYLVVSALLGGLTYVAYLSFVPQAKKSKKKTANVSAPVTVTATSAGGYQEEWIPDHHKPKASKKKGTGAVSGDELSGAETSGAEGRKEKTRKRK